MPVRFSYGSVKNTVDEMPINLCDEQEKSCKNSMPRCV